VQKITGRAQTRWGLIQRRETLVPTRRGWAVLALVLALLFIGFVLEIHSFLAVTSPLPGGVLVVEGWAPDYALQEAVLEFRRAHYDKVYVTGGPLAQRGAASLEKLGLSTNELQALPAPPVRRDRTYTSAVSLARWFREHGMKPARVNVLTEDTHSRRSRLLFQKALGNEVQVGVIAIPPADYDPKRWWRSSGGVRSVIGETLAYGYVRLFFWPSSQLK
jgi:hypothetical protein